MQNGFHAWVVWAMVLTGLIGLGNTSFEVTAQDYGWMQTGQWFTYDVNGWINGTNQAVENGELKVLAISVTGLTIQLNEVYQSDTTLQSQKIPYVWTYDRAARQNLNLSGAFAWVWVREEDATFGSATINGEYAVLTETTPQQWKFVHTGQGGNSSTYYFDRTTGLLATAQGYHTSPGIFATHIITRVASGIGGMIPDWPDVSNYTAPQSPPDPPGDGPSGTRGGARPEPLSHITNFYPPWCCESHWTFLEGGGIHSKHASSSANPSTGYEFTEAGAYAGPGVGWAGAHGDALIQLPYSMYFTVTTTGAYRWRTHHTLNGDAGFNGLCNRFPFGGAGAGVRVIVRNELHEWTTGVSISEIDATVLDWRGPWTFYWAWSNFHFDVERDTYLNAGTKYFIFDWLQADAAATAWGICASYGHTHFSSTVIRLELIRL